MTAAFSRGFLARVCGAVLGLAAISVGADAVAQSLQDPAVMRAPEDGGARRFEVIADSLQLRDGPSLDAVAVAEHPAATILSNLGCAETAAQIWCEVRPFRGGTRGFAPAELLRPAEGPDGLVPMGLDDSKRRARKRDFDARAELACAQEQGQSLGRCKAAVARSEGGDATVVVTFPNGFARSLYFVHGEFVRASSTMSGVGTDMDWGLEDGIYVLRVDDQRYELPADLIFSR